MVGGLYQEDLRGIQPRQERRSSCPSAAHKAVKPCANSTSQVAFGSFSPATSPLVTHCFGRDSSGEAGVENLDAKHALLALCRMRS